MWKFTEYNDSSIEKNFTRKWRHTLESDATRYHQHKNSGFQQRHFHRLAGLHLLLTLHNLFSHIDNLRDILSRVTSPHHQPIHKVKGSNSVWWGWVGGNTTWNIQKSHKRQCCKEISGRIRQNGGRMNWEYNVKCFMIESDNLKVNAADINYDSNLQDCLTNTHTNQLLSIELVLKICSWSMGFYSIWSISMET